MIDSIFLEKWMLSSVNKNHCKIVAYNNTNINEENSKTHDQFVFDKKIDTWNMVNQER